MINIIQLAVVSMIVGIASATLMLYIYIPLQLQIQQTKDRVHDKPISVTAKPLFYGSDTRTMSHESNVTLSVYSGGIVKININLNASSLAGFDPANKAQLEGLYLIDIWCNDPRVDFQSLTTLNVVDGFGKASLDFILPLAGYQDCSIILENKSQNIVLMAHWQYLTLT